MALPLFRITSLGESNMKDNRGLLSVSCLLSSTCLRPRRASAVSGSAHLSLPALSCFPSRSHDYGRCWRMCPVVTNLTYRQGHWWPGGQDSTPLSQAGFASVTGYQESLRETRKGQPSPTKEPLSCLSPSGFHRGGTSLHLPVSRPFGSPPRKFLQGRESLSLLPQISATPSSKSVYLPTCYLHRHGEESSQKSWERDGLESLFSSRAVLKKDTHSHHTPVATSSPVREWRRDLVVFTGNATKGQVTLASRNSLSLLSGEANVYSGHGAVGKSKSDTFQRAKVWRLSRAPREWAGNKLLSSHETSLEYAVRSFSYPSAFSFRRRDSSSGPKRQAALSSSRDGGQSLRHQQARRYQQEEKNTQRRTSYVDESKRDYALCSVPGFLQTGRSPHRNYGTSSPTKVRTRIPERSGSDDNSASGSLYRSISPSEGGTLPNRRQPSPLRHSFWPPSLLSSDSRGGPRGHSSSLSEDKKLRKRSAFLSASIRGGGVPVEQVQFACTEMAEKGLPPSAVFWKEIADFVVTKCAVDGSSGSGVKICWLKELNGTLDASRMSSSVAGASSPFATTSPSLPSPSSSPLPRCSSPSESSFSLLEASQPSFLLTVPDFCFTVHAFARAGVLACETIPASTSVPSDSRPRFSSVPHLQPPGWTSAGSDPLSFSSPPDRHAVSVPHSSTPFPRFAAELPANRPPGDSSLDRLVYHCPASIHSAGRLYMTAAHLFVRYPSAFRGGDVALLTAAFVKANLQYEQFYYDLLDFLLAPLPAPSSLPTATTPVTRSADKTKVLPSSDLSRSPKPGPLSSVAQTSASCAKPCHTSSLRRSRSASASPKKEISLSSFHGSQSPTEELESAFPESLENSSRLANLDFEPWAVATLLYAIASAPVTLPRPQLLRVFHLFADYLLGIDQQQPREKSRGQEVSECVPNSITDSCANASGSRGATQQRHRFPKEMILCKMESNNSWRGLSPFSNVMPLWDLELPSLATLAKAFIRVRCNRPDLFENARLVLDKAVLPQLTKTDGAEADFSACAVKVQQVEEEVTHWGESEPICGDKVSGRPARGDGRRSDKRKSGGEYIQSGAWASQEGTYPGSYQKLFHENGSARDRRGKPEGRKETLCEDRGAGDIKEEKGLGIALLNSKQVTPDRRVDNATVGRQKSCLPMSVASSPSRPSTCDVVPPPGTPVVPLSREGVAGFSPYASPAFQFRATVSRPRGMSVEQALVIFFDVLVDLLSGSLNSSLTTVGRDGVRGEWGKSKRERPSQVGGERDAARLGTLRKIVGLLLPHVKKNMELSGVMTLCFALSKMAGREAEFLRPLLEAVAFRAREELQRSVFRRGSLDAHPTEGSRRGGVTLSRRDVSNFAQCFGRLAYSDPLFLEALDMWVPREATRCAPQDIVGILYAYRQLRHAPARPEVLEALLNATSRLAPQLTVQQVVTVFSSFSRLRTTTSATNAQATFSTLCELLLQTSNMRHYVGDSGENRRQDFTPKPRRSRKGSSREADLRPGPLVERGSSGNDLLLTPLHLSAILGALGRMGICHEAFFRAAGNLLCADGLQRVFFWDLHAIKDAYARTNFKHPALYALVEKHLSRMPRRPKGHFTLSVDANLSVRDVRQADVEQNNMLARETSN
ncbi:transcription termination factor rho [Cystoisospora suis]|uniref:Transcription termination factor rho n=1 Tax=Cystoisospora suis TaxID=483139 RepID=A0A2C6LC30_9APIC|nr:transcription termination factor rho [Cystoisospora suis]